MSDGLKGNAEISTNLAEPNPSKLELAQASGRFYNSLLDVYLSRGNDKQTQIDSLVNDLPLHARELYQKGLKTFDIELQENHELIAQHPEEEAKYLIGCVLVSDSRDKAQVDEILSHITPDQAIFVEPTEGVGIIQVEHELYDYLVQAEVVTGHSEAIHFGSVAKGQPDFVIVRRHRNNAALSDESVDPSKNTSLRHEFHHLIWNFLQRGKFLREPQEATLELSMAFGNFRNELAAYIIDGRNIMEVDLDAMVYTDNRDIHKIAGSSKASAYVCMELARSKGVDLSQFLYPAMTSKGFEELNRGMVELTPIDEQVSVESASAMYDLYGKKNALLENIKAILRDKNVTISSETVREVAMTRLSMAEGNTTMRDMQSRADDLARFGQELTGVALPMDDLLIQTLSGKLPFSEQAIVEILKLPRKVRDSMPLVNDPTTFIRSFVSMWQVDDEDFRASYSQIADSSPEMRSVFDGLKAELIARDANMIRGEYAYDNAYEPKKAKIDGDIQRKSDYIRSL